MYPDDDHHKPEPGEGFLALLRSIFSYDKRPWNFKPEGFREKVDEFHEKKEISLAEFNQLIDSTVPDKEQMVKLSDRMHAYYVLQSMTYVPFPLCVAIWGCIQMYQGHSVLSSIAILYL